MKAKALFHNTAESEIVYIIYTIRNKIIEGKMVRGRYSLFELADLHWMLSSKEDTKFVGVKFDVGDVVIRKQLIGCGHPWGKFLSCRIL